MHDDTRGKWETRGKIGNVKDPSGSWSVQEDIFWGYCTASPDRQEREKRSCFVKFTAATLMCRLRKLSVLRESYGSHLPALYRNLLGVDACGPLSNHDGFSPMKK